MRTMFAVLFGGSVALSVGSIAALWSERHRDVVMFWFLTALAAAAAAVDGVLFVAILGATVSPWWLATALVLQDGVFGWRLWLALRVRLRNRQGPPG